MSLPQFIGFDVHCSFTEVAVVRQSGKLVRRDRCSTTIPALTQLLESIRRPRHLTFEEGPLADWLTRNLAVHTDELIVCNPRRNHLIAKDSDKDDPIDAEKLAQLYRGNYLKPVHQSQSLERSVLKQHVALYHDRIRRRVQEANRILSQLRRHGVFASESAFQDEEGRVRLLHQLPCNRTLTEDLWMLWDGYDAIAAQVSEMRDSLIALAQREEPIGRFVALPGIAWIRAATFYVYLDTPWRFPSKSALWKYCGIGLERRHSGNGPTQLRVARQVNRSLKNAMLGAAITAIRHGKNPFAIKYQQWKEAGLSLRNARRNVARTLTSTLWGMWKNGQVYRPEWVLGNQSAGDRCG